MPCQCVALAASALVPAPESVCSWMEAFDSFVCGIQCAAREENASMGHLEEEITVKLREVGREARRQGERAVEAREREDEKACDTRGRWEVTAAIKQGAEGLIALETFWRNGRWHLPYPHAGMIDPAKN